LLSFETKWVGVRLVVDEVGAGVNKGRSRMRPPDRLVGPHSPLPSTGV